MNPMEVVLAFGAFASLGGVASLGHGFQQCAERQDYGGAGILTLLQKHMTRTKSATGFSLLQDGHERQSDPKGSKRFQILAKHGRKFHRLHKKMLHSKANGGMLEEDSDVIPEILVKESQNSTPAMHAKTPHQLLQLKFPSTSPQLPLLQLIQWKAAEGPSRGEAVRNTPLVPAVHQMSKLCNTLSLLFGFAFACCWYLNKLGSSYAEQCRMLLFGGSWMACCVGMHTLNKELVSILNSPSLIAVLQMAMAALAIFAKNPRVVIEALIVYPQQLRRWVLVVPVLYSAVSLTSLFTYAHVTLCAMTVVRNLGPLVALLIEPLMMPTVKQALLSWETFAAMLTMLVGAVMYAAVVPSLSILGLAFAGLNMMIAVIDRMVQRHLLFHEGTDVTVESCTFVTFFGGMILALGVAFLTNELHNVNSREWLRFDVWVLLFQSAVVGLGIHYIGLAVQGIMSVDSFLVMQDVARVLVVVVGIGVFGDPIQAPFIVLALFLSLMGSFWYGKAQLSNRFSSGRSQDVCQKVIQVTE